MLFYLLKGIGLGFAAASGPGPFQTYLISQTLTRRWQSLLPAARVGPKVNRALLGISAIALVCFGLYQLWLGVLDGGLR